MVIRNIAQNAAGFTSNAFLVDGDRTVLVDAGNDFDAVAAIDATTGGLDAVVLTHTHSDHVGNVADVVEAFEVEVYGFDPDHELVDRGIDDGSSVSIGDHEYEALHTPGHKNDHLCFYSEPASVCFAGDLVFANGGFGRTDLEEGNRELLIRSIDYLLETIDPSLSELHVGHGPSVEVNPYQHVELASQAARMG